jgi:hypothetical protein
MTVALLDGVTVMSTTGGTGAAQIAGPAPGYLAPFAAGGVAGQQYGWKRESQDGQRWEMFIGALTAGTPTTISHDEVVLNHAGGQTAVNWEAGEVTYITCVALSRYFQYGGNPSAWDRLSVDVIASPVSGLIKTLPPGYSRFRIAYQDVTPAAGAVDLYFRLIVGGLVLQGANDYPYRQTISGGATITPSGGAINYGRVAPGSPGSAAGDLEFCPSGVRAWWARAHVRDGNAVHAGFEASGWVPGTSSGYADQIALAFVNTNIAAGRFSLWGALG